MHDPEIFPEPFVFNPHRWLPSASNATTAATRKSDVEQSDSKKERQRLSEMHERHLGFGFGPRSCPGMRLAVVEGKCAVANILRNFRVRLGCSSDEVKWVRQFTVQPSKLPLLLARRDADM
jgi:cytochrome P450